MRAELGQPEIRTAARELLAAAGVSAPPVDLVQVAALQGIKQIRYRKMKQTLGTLREGPDGLSVTLNRREPFRARFTLAHEIAHTMIDPPEGDVAAVVLNQRTPRASDEVERLCDKIAVELLMPFEMFEEAMGEEPVSMGGIFRLAKLFDSSLQATALRAGELSTQPVQVVCWQRNGRRGARVKAKRGQEFLTAGADWSRELDDASPIGRAFRSKETERGTEVVPPHNAYECEARGFLSGNARFVISVVRPAGMATENLPSARQS